VYAVVGLWLVFVAAPYGQSALPLNPPLMERGKNALHLPKEIELVQRFVNAVRTMLILQAINMAAVIKTNRIMCRTYWYVLFKYQVIAENNQLAVVFDIYLVRAVRIDMSDMMVEFTRPLSDPDRIVPDVISGFRTLDDRAIRE
jgi:hypothetical protein